MDKELVLLLCFVVGVNSQDPLVAIETGTIAGKAVDYRDKQAFVFYSIPYAQPPLGDLRFKPPRPVEKWAGTKDVSDKKPNACHQKIDDFFGDFVGATQWNPVTEVSEDCLYLSVYAPARPMSGAAVLVFIHGGALNSGSNALPFYDGRALAVEHDIIVVTFNYRLGSLGFLYMDEEEVPGNVGLMDQNLALEWVQKNIESFGGSPDKVTLFGESAGALAVGLHMLHRRSWDKFNQAILQSGSMLMEYVQSAEEGLRVAGLVREAVGCPEGNISDVAACLREVDPVRLTEEQYVTGGLSPVGPVVDGAWLRDSPREMLSDGRFKKCPILAGVNRNEGAYFLIYDIPHLVDRNGYKMNQMNLQEAIRKLFTSYMDYPNITHMSSVAIAAIEDRLTNWENPSDKDKNYPALEEAYGLKNFTCPLIEVENVYSKDGQDVYSYQFSHRSRESVWPEYMGVIHGDELFYVFGDPFMREHLYEGVDRNVSSIMMKFWADFAKNGNPDDKWPKYTEDDQTYLDITAETPEDFWAHVKSRLHADGCHFWTELIPALNQEGYCLVGGASSLRPISFIGAALLLLLAKILH